MPDSQTPPQAPKGIINQLEENNKRGGAVIDAAVILGTPLIENEFKKEFKELLHQGKDEASAAAQTADKAATNIIDNAKENHGSMLEQVDKIKKKAADAGITLSSAQPLQGDVMSPTSSPQNMSKSPKGIV